MPIAQFGGERGARIAEPLRKHLARRREIVGMDERESAHANQIFGLIPEHTIVGGVRVAHDSFPVEDNDHVRRILHDGAKVFLALTERLFGLFACQPHLSFLQLPFNGRAQAHELTLADEIARARFHRSHREFFSDLAGDDDDGDVDAVVPEELERHRGAELRHDPVAGNHLPRLTLECGYQRGRRIDALPRGLIAAAP